LLSEFISSGPPRLKAVARTILFERDRRRGQAELEAALVHGEIVEKQAAYQAFGNAGLVAPLEAGMKQLLSDKLAPEVRLDVLLAAQKSKDAALAKLANDYRSNLDRNDPLASFRVALAGGDAERGRTIFWSHSTAQCVRCHKATDADGKANGGDAGPNL